MPALEKLVEQTLKEERCISYELWKEDDQARSFMVYERFRDRESFNRHLHAPYIQHFIENEYATCVESHWDMDFSIMTRDKKELTAASAPLQTNNNM